MHFARIFIARQSRWRKGPFFKKDARQVKRLNAINALYNKDGLWCAGWIAVQQVVVASSTVFVVWLMKELTDHQRLSLVYMALFVGSLIGVYVPTALSHVYLERFKFTSFKTYVANFSKRNRMRRTLAHRRVKNEYESWITNESYLVFEETTWLLYDVFATFLNVLLNVIAISISLHHLWLFVGYMGAFIVLYGSNRFFRRNIERSSSAVQDSRKSMSQVLLAAWDNVFIGNQHNFERWWESFVESTTKLESRTIMYTVKQALISGGTMVCALALVGYSVFLYVQGSGGDLAALSALVVTFPRQIQIIQSIFDFIRSMVAWEGIKARLQGLEKPLQLEDENSSSYIFWDQLKFWHQGHCLTFKGMDELQQFLLVRPNVRLTITGPNGAGKSTLLAVLAAELGKNAFFLPTRSDLIFDSKELPDASDGQWVKLIFDEIRQDTTIPDTVILDEWDANLDQKNMHALSQQLENLATERRVIEVRHRWQGHRG